MSNLINNLFIIVAVDNGAGFSKNGKIPWLDEPWANNDLKRFKSYTDGNICIMGRHTFEEMLSKAEKRWEKNPENKDLLPGRESWVLSKNRFYPAKGAYTSTGLRECLNKINKNNPNENRKIFILGGELLFIESLSWNPTINMTIIDKNFNCDKKFPIKFLNKKYKIVSGIRDPDYDFIYYTFQQYNKYERRY